MFYKIVSDEDSQGKIFISAYFYTVSNSNNIDLYSYISFGTLNHSIKIVIVPDLGRKIIKISSDIVSYFKMPLDILYQVEFNDKEIILGPVIGILAASHKSQLNENKLTKLIEYTKIYESIHGLLYVFSSEGIDLKDGSVDGYYFKIDDNKQPVWINSKLPLPSAIYRTVPLSRNLRIQLKEAVNNKVFNSLFIHKLNFEGITENINNSSINTLIVKNKRVNLKIIMQKNEFSKWICSGIIVNLTNNIEPNFISFSKLAKEIMELTQSEMDALKQNIFENCNKVCSMLDDSKEIYGDICIDAVMTADYRINILKINRKYDHKLPLLIKDHEMYQKIRITPVRYLLGLSGFKILN
ncbi:MAG: hypothetical protein Q8900_06260 [Bacillota bacterium]|nr:hypothetical protein [Bacillota bacterium]